MTTDNVHTQQARKGKGKRQVQEFADNGRRTGLAQEIPVRGNQVTLMRSLDEGDLGADLRDQGGKGKIRKIRKTEVGRKDQTIEDDQTPQ